MIIADRGRKLNFVWLKLLFGLQGHTEVELADLLRIVQFDVKIFSKIRQEKETVIKISVLRNNGSCTHGVLFSNQLVEERMTIRWV